MPTHPRFDEFISLFDVRRSKANQYTCVCPAHDDHQASLCISEGDKGIVLHCQAGCSVADVLGAVGWVERDLFYPGEDAHNSNTQPRRRRTNSNDAKPKPVNTNTNDTPELKPWERIESTYPYADAAGVIKYCSFRLHSPKSFRQAQPDPNDPARYIWNMDGVTPLPYQLPRLLMAIKENLPIYIVEGEKDVASLRDIGLVATTNHGGAGKWTDAHSKYLAGADVIIIPDNDVPGCDHAMQVACSASQYASSVKYLPLHTIPPGLPPKADVSDWLGIDGNNAEKLAAWVKIAAKKWIPGCIIEASDEAIAQHKEAKAHRVTAKLSETSDLPIIRISGRQQREITADAVASLEAMPNSPLYIRMGRLVRLRTQVSSEIRHAYIDETTPDIIRHLMSESANYIKLTQTMEERSAFPPLDIARDILARGHWEFPQLDAVTESPVMRPDGSILVDPGYDEATHLFYAADNSLSLPAIPDNPTSADVARAYELISDILIDFPFVAQADRTNLIAMMLTQVIRPAIDGLIPMGIINAPQPGSGKGLLTKLISLIATGKPPSSVTAPTAPEEWTKQLTAIIAGGATTIVFDNVEATLESPDLASFLTASQWQARILGQSKIIAVPNRSVVLVTGNNVKVAGDIARRCYWATINPRTSTPELRANFKHKNLCQYVLTRRGEILAALFTLARAWFVAGQPAPTASPIVGSFEEWSTMIGGILEHSGITAFLANAEEIRAASDVSSNENEVFLEAVHTIYRNLPFTIKELSADIDGNAAFKDCIPDHLLIAREKSEASFARSCGRLFSRITGRRYGASNIAVIRNTTKGEGSKTRWFVECDDVDTLPPLPTATSSDAAWA